MAQEERNLSEEFTVLRAEYWKKRELREAYEEDRDEQFEGFTYTLTCDVCGAEVFTNLVTRYFDPRSGVLLYMQDIFDDMFLHNMTHYEPLNTE
jgi:hypothetical protein